MTSRFRFRLQPVLEHRERVLDGRQRAFAQKQRDLADAEAIAAALDTERENQRAALTRDHKRITVDELRATYAHLAFLDRSIADQAARRAACNAELEQAQAELIAANTDRKVLQTLKARRFEAHRADEAQLEQRDVDDQNARRYVRTLKPQENES